MTAPSTRHDGYAIVGLGVAACVACCVGPLVGVLGAIGVASTLLFGAAGWR